MKKKTILIFWIIGIIVALIGTGMLVPSIVAAANHCTTNQFGGQNCSLPTGDPLAIVGFVGLIILCIGGLLHTIAWMGALIRSAQMKSWGWFVVVLLFSSLGTLIYALVTPSDQPVVDYPSLPHEV